MKIINRIFLTAMLLCSTTACHSQNKEEMNEKVNTLLGNLYRDVQYQDESINYQMQITIGGCGFEILVNDLVVYRDPGADATEILSLNKGINNNILKSGIQNWEVRVYPPCDKDFNLKVLPKTVSIMLRINAVRYNSQGVTQLAEPIYLLQTPQVEKDGEMVYADAGKPMMVYKGTFEAHVPYSLTGWSRGKDLRKMDQQKLEDMLVKEYRLLGSYIKNGELDKLAQKLQKSYREESQSLFYTQQTNIDILEAFYEGYGRKDLKVYPIENYRMTFWGNGRIITLERTDYIFNAALITEYPVERKGQKGMEHISYELYFHIPEGSDQLEIIR